MVMTNVLIVTIMTIAVTDNKGRQIPAIITLSAIMFILAVVLVPCPPPPTPTPNPDNHPTHIHTHNYSSSYSVSY